MGEADPPLPPLPGTQPGSALALFFNGDPCVQGSDCDIHCATDSTGDELVHVCSVTPVHDVNCSPP